MSLSKANFIRMGDVFEGPARVEQRECITLARVQEFAEFALHQ